MKQPPNSYTIHKFAQLSGFDRNAIARRIEEIQAQPSAESSQGARLYHLRDLVRALLGGDIEAERLRKTRVEADLIEHNLAVRRRDFVPVSEVEAFVIWTCTAIKAVIITSPLEHREQDEILRRLRTLHDHDWSKGPPKY